MLDEVVRKPNPESDRLVSYGNNNTATFKKIETSPPNSKNQNYGPLGR